MAAPSVTEDVASAPVSKRRAMAAQSSVSIGFTRVATLRADAGGRAEVAAQQIVVVDRMTQNRATTLARPCPAPRHGVVIRPAVPVRLKRGHLRRPTRPAAISASSAAVPRP